MHGPFSHPGNRLGAPVSHEWLVVCILAARVAPISVATPNRNPSCPPLLPKPSQRSLQAQNANISRSTAVVNIHVMFAGNPIYL